ncbi:MAG: bifunctional (p)ppGpp synthetase/guanosine-3',5'-bis(diphosphate) 3'-pyrophosphohydrolase [Lamprobacter sp.]|uniref:RelA/SpoT family protein n=1 Tax=Lamprobacter sp. TaxID=3100796 RepID=UPI002B256ED1|nr:bifunctional (p)ppGpp synthetase/guanosine-3',5'-bis(diphosphate) 3'-pyrophosphohydrolase [Lamprobacter sp.]MEA3643317.1 bifunctional (p)ppGpp synthetase/guanosine-3',5'-bis(diphosphate) 3'-pyrophosphohydrolase [Lamprobacter sp.]
MVTSTTTLPAAEIDDHSAAALWLDRIPAHYGEQDRARIAEAIALMQRCVGDELLETGESAARHRLGTADILMALRLDGDTLCAALLSGCIGHAEIDSQLLDQRCGASIARMVEDLGRIAQLAELEPEASGTGRDKPREHARREENLRRMLLAMAKDVRTILIVLAEQLHLLRAAKALPRERQQALAEDTKRLYAPLANRLGVWQLKWELEDLALRYRQPDEYQRIARLLRERRDERQQYIASVIDTLRQEFARIGLEASISGRPKHIYSIWRKMQRKSVDIDGIFDLRAVRIMVETEDDCYSALSVVHSLWPYIPDEFDDYISKPKGNLYRSLHTAVTGPDGKVLEVQIRTQEMHQHAEYGIAAHWAYKEAAGHDAAFQRRIVLMRNWLESTLETEPPHELAASIYVMTPQAKVVELPPGATPLDFAYAIHSEVGHHCRGARVDGRIVPLTHKLANGETVEIITQKNATPSRDWLSIHQGYLTTARARNRVRQWFKQQDYDRHLAEGRNLLDKELTRLGIEAKPPLEQLAERFNLQRGDDVLAAIGRGDLSVGIAARQVGEPRHDRHDRRELPSEAEQAVQIALGRRKRPAHGRPEVVVAGVPDLMTQIASCCHPVPYDPIIGFITRGRGVAVHRANCPNISHLSDDEQERLIEVEWSDQPDHAAYPVDIVIIAADRRGLLRDVSSVLADEDANVIATETQTDATNDRASMRFRVEVSNVDQLEQLCAKLRQLTDVIEVRRSDR